MYLEYRMSAPDEFLNPVFSAVYFVLGGDEGSRLRFEMWRILQSSVRRHSRDYCSSVKTFQDVPSLTLLDILKFTNPYNEKHLKSTFESFFRKHGKIFRTRLPGTRYDIVYISDPEDAQILLNNDGQFPIIQGFDFFVSYRNKVSQSSLFIIPSC